MKFAPLFVCAALGLSAVGHAEPKWLTSYSEAAKQSKRHKKPIMAFFTGSDWCGWCKKLDAEVFATGEFDKWSKNVILLKLDFPKSKPQPDWEHEQNLKLQAKYSISGYPSIRFLTWDGKEISQSGYVEGGAAAWINKTSEIFNAAIKK